jgi:hypothetical protein
MEALLDFAAVSGAVIVSLGIALSLEWFALNGLLKMMPPRQPIAASAAERDVDASEAGPKLVATTYTSRQRAA